MPYLRKHTLHVLAALLLVLPQASFTQQDVHTVSFLVVGDWGTGGAGARRVGKAMAEQHRRASVQAILSTGDNIYPSGVSSVDDPQWESKFERIFPHEALPAPFWAVLGNHDYRKDPDAQVAYTGKRLSDGNITRWTMPGRWWTTVFRSPDTALSVRVVGIDTQMLVGNAGTRKRHLAWIDSVLGAAGETHLLVIGHHPVYSHGLYGNNSTLTRHLAPVLERHGVVAYLNGHEHDLQLIEAVNGVRYIISGGGGGKRKSSAGKRTEFSAGSLGFVRLDMLASSMRITFIDDKGKTLYSTTDRLNDDR